jgi:hypothetical protein
MVTVSPTNSLLDEAANLLINKRWTVAEDLKRRLAAMVQGLIELFDTQLEQNDAIDRVVRFSSIFQNFAKS